MPPTMPQHDRPFMTSTDARHVNLSIEKVEDGWIIHEPSKHLGEMSKRYVSRTPGGVAVRLQQIAADQIADIMKDIEEPEPETAG